jgi:hypothetical protein
MAAGTVPSAPAIGRSRLEASREWIVASQRAICDGNLASSSNTELLAQDVGVGFGGSRGDAQTFPDFIVGAAGGDEFDDLPLSLGDGWKRVSQGVVHRGQS